MLGIYNNGLGNKCPICGKEDIEINCNDIRDEIFLYKCTNCGKFFAPNISYDSLISSPEAYPEFNFNRSHLKNYMFYHKSIHTTPFIADPKSFNQYIDLGYTKIYNITPEIVENWYPKNLNEKIDEILLYYNSQAQYLGDLIECTYKDLLDIYLMDYNVADLTIRMPQKYIAQIRYINNYLGNLGYAAIASNVYVNGGSMWEQRQKLELTPKGLARIEELQKNQVNNKNVFVAMKFGEETQALREKIKEGLEGYNVRIMDEIEHNHQIVPEMLYEIRNSRFVIAELSNHNNGAYYEAGYALGLGKEVIHICQKSELSNGLHFDVAQVNTIVYESIDEIPGKLKKRIQATIK